MIRRIIAAISKPAPIPTTTERAKALAAVKGLDSNAAARRAVIKQNRADLRAILSKGKENE